MEPVKIQGSVKGKAAEKKINSAWLPAAVLLLAFFAYSNTFGVGFFLDNEEIILKDPRVHSLSSVQLHRILTQQYWETATTGLYRPLTTLSYLFNYAILGNSANPEGYHWVNLLLHLANTCLVYLLGMAIFAHAPRAALLSALWALHPAHTEAVTNIVGRADLLVAFGVLGALLCHRNALTSGGRQRAIWIAGVVLASSAGVFAKESGVVAMCVLAVWDLTFGGSVSWRLRAAGYIAAVVPCAAYLYARARVLANSPFLPTAYTDNPLLGADFWTARLTAIKIIGKYLLLLLWPAQLSYDYSYNEIPPGADVQAVCCLLGCIAAAGLALWCWRRHPAVSFAIAFAAITFAPVSNLAVIIGTPMGDRFLYLPAIGVMAIAVWAAWRWQVFARNRNAAVALTGVILIALLARTYARNGDWLDQHRFWRTGVEAAPGSYKTHINVATTTAFLTSDDWDRAIREADRALAILDPLPDSKNTGRAYRDAGTIYREVGERIASKNPAGTASAGTTPEFWYRKSLGAVLRSEKIELAFDANYREENARRGRPGLSAMPSRLYLEMGRTYMRLNDLGHALSAFERGLALEAAPELLEEAAAAYQQAGDLHLAAIALEESYTVDSNRPVLGKLVDLYAQMDPAGCAVSREAGQSALNPDCPLVHRDICAASRSIAQTYANRGQPFEAGAVRKRAIEYLGCAAELVN